MTATLEMPQLSGGRKRAIAMIAAANIPTDLTGAEVSVDCRQLRAGTESFADELVRTVLVDRNAERLRADNVTEKFSAYLIAAAEFYAVRDRLDVSPG